MKTQIVDYNIVQNGEVSAPLHRLLQEIETIIVSDGNLITMPDVNLNLDQYLFKYGQNENAIARNIQSVLDNNIINDGGFMLHVEVQFMHGIEDKDTMLINININKDGLFKEKLTYAISA